MDTLKLTLISISVLTICSCQLGYLTKSAYNQLSLLNQRVPIEDALNDPGVTNEEKAKLKLSQDVRLFSENTLKLNVKKNYSTFVKLDRPYVSYVVSASPKWTLETHYWNFPIKQKQW